MKLVLLLKLSNIYVKNAENTAKRDSMEFMKIAAIFSLKWK